MVPWLRLLPEGISNPKFYGLARAKMYVLDLRPVFNMASYNPSTMVDLHALTLRLHQIMYMIHQYRI